MIQTGFRRVVSRLLLADVESHVRLFTEAERAAHAAQVRRAQQKVDAAKVLWFGEQPAEALRLALQALEETERAASSAVPAAVGGEAGARPDPASTSGLAGARPEDVDAVRRARDLGRSLSPLPESNADVGPDHERFHQDAVAAVEAALGRLARVALTPAQIARRRGLRIGGAAAVLILCAVFAWNRSRAPKAVLASGQYGNLPKFAPAEAVDGDPSSEWLLPNHTPGWIEIQLRPKTLRTVKILNARNLPFNDRGAAKVKVEVFFDGKIRHAANQDLGALAPGAWAHVPLPPGRVDTIRVTVETYRLFGGGLAEIAWE